MMPDGEVAVREASREKFNISLHPTRGCERARRRLLQEIGRESVGGGQILDEVG
jgi:hypothetical protein